MVGRPDDSDWSGALRLGITNVDPNSLKTCLPKYACPDLITKDGFWARPIKEELAKEKTRYQIQIPYACHYKPRFCIYFYPVFQHNFFAFKEVF